MFKNRFLVVIGVISFLLVTLAVSSPRSHASSTANFIPSDLYQQHPEWWWRTTNQNVGIPLTGSSDDAFPDYYQRHPELSVPALIGLAASDYFIRHPELVAPAASTFDMTDYYFRQAAIKAAARTIDLTDYFFRHR
jgi:hypothetical protein